MQSRRSFLAQCTAVSLTLASDPWARSAPAPKQREEGDALKLITPETRKAIEAGLKYLENGQNIDGSFGKNAYKGNVAVTSLAGLAFLAAGHQADASARGRLLGKALDFVLSQENLDGTHPGYLHNPLASPHGPMYGHGFGTLFLAQLEGKIKDRKVSDLRKKILERAVQLIVKSQNAEGGWRYQPVSRDADLSVTACQMEALAAAHAAGLKVPAKTTDAGITYVKKCQDKKGGWFRYMILGGGGAGMQSFARTAAGVAVLQSMGVKGPEVEKGLAFIVKNRPKAVGGGRPDMHYFYGNYFAVQALHHAGGATWKDWYNAVRKDLLKAQDRDGSWVDQIDTHYATAMACLVLLAPEGRFLVKPKKK